MSCGARAVGPNRCFSFVGPEGMSSRQLPEFAATLMVRICDTITGHRGRPVRVELRHATACPMLARYLGLPVMVDQPHPALVLDAASLAVPVINADPRLLELLRRYADDVLARRAGRTTSWPGPSAGFSKTSIPATSAWRGWRRASA